MSFKRGEHKIIKKKNSIIDFNVHNAFEEIQNKFREDFDRIFIIISLFRISTIS